MDHTLVCNLQNYLKCIKNENSLAFLLLYKRNSLHDGLVKTKQKPSSRTVDTEKECSCSSFVVHLPVFHQTLR